MLSIRKHDDFVFFMPDFDGLSEDPNESFPPNYIKNKGVLYFEYQKYQNIFKPFMKPGYFSAKDPITLSTADLTHILKYEIENLYLKETLTPKSIEHHFVTETSHQMTNISQIFFEKLNILQNFRTFKLKCLELNQKTINLHPVHLNVPEWKIMTETQELILGNIFVIKIE